MIKFIDLFAGTGGIRLGFEQACKKFDLERNVFSPLKLIKMPVPLMNSISDIILFPM